MKYKPGILYVFALACLALLLGACSGKTVVESDLAIKGAPDWVNEGTNILSDKDGRLFHGVGSAGPMGDDSLQRSAADERARAELARILSSYMDVVSRDYVASAQSGGDAAADQSVSRQIENLSRVNLTGARVIGRWHDKRTKTVYSIAELDMKHVKETLGMVQEMNQSLREFIDTQGDNIFDGMAGGKK